MDNPVTEEKQLGVLRETFSAYGTLWTFWAAPHEVEVVTRLFLVEEAEERIPILVVGSTLEGVGKC